MTAIGLDEYEIDRMRPSDHNFVVKTWVRGSRMTQGGMRMPLESHNLFMRDTVVETILRRGGSVFVARDVESPTFVYGFLVAERIGPAVVVHWCHVKRDWRGKGIARALLDAAVGELGSGGATRLEYSHCARVLDERTVDGRRKLVPTFRLEDKLARMGFVQVAIGSLLGKREAA